MSGKCYFLIDFQKIAENLFVLFFLFCDVYGLRTIAVNLGQKSLFVNKTSKSYNQVVCFELDVVLPWMLLR